MEDLDEKKRLQQEELIKKKSEAAKNGISPMKEHRLAVEANRMEVREKVKIKLR